MNTVTITLLPHSLSDRKNCSSLFRLREDLVCIHFIYLWPHISPSSLQPRHPVLPSHTLNFWFGSFKRTCLKLVWICLKAPVRVRIPYTSGLVGQFSPPSNKYFACGYTLKTVMNKLPVTLSLSQWQKCTCLEKKLKAAKRKARDLAEGEL